MKTKLSKLAAALTTLFLATASTVQADVLDGQTVRTTFREDFIREGYFLQDSRNVVVGPEIELTDFGHVAHDEHSVHIDLSDTNILITSRVDSWSPGRIYSVRFEDVYGTIPRFTSVTLNPATTWPGYDSSLFTVEANTIRVIFPTGVPSLGAQISLDITAMIPEPATAGLLFVGVVILASGRRRPAHTVLPNSPMLTISSFETDNA